jgi:hypothetical protein
MTDIQTQVKEIVSNRFDWACHGGKFQEITNLSPQEYFKACLDWASNPTEIEYILATRLMYPTEVILREAIGYSREYHNNMRDQLVAEWIDA